MKLKLSELYRNVFGYRAAPFAPDNLGKRVEPVDGWPAETFTAPTDVQYSSLGTPYAMRTMLNGEYLPNEPLISITGAKNIVSTAIDGRDGAFLEMVNRGNYVITIQGICIDENDSAVFPESQVRAIRNLYEENESLTVVNDLLAMFNIDLVALTNIEMNPIPGAMYQPYTITGMSDREWDLELNED